MSIEFVCPTCSGTLRVGDESAGRVIRCGSCLTMLRVPGDAAEPPPAPHDRDAPAAPPSPFEVVPDPADAPAGEPALAAAVPVARPRNRDRNDDRPRRDEDRPRRRRRPAPPPGRGVLFWLALIGGLCLLLTFGCCGGLYLLVPGPNWQKHESAKGGFRVDLPAPPRADMDQLAGGKAGPNMTVEGTVLFGRFEEYAVVYGEIPPHERQWLTDKQRIDAAVDGMKGSNEVRAVLSQRDVTVSGFPGREVEFSANGSGWYAARVVVAEGRVYVIVAGGRFAKPGNANARRFLDSFEVTDPKIKASGEERLAAAKRAEEQERARKEQERVRQEQARMREEQDERAQVGRERAEAERQREQARLVEEKRAAEEARRAKVRAANEAFLREPYTGPAVPAVGDDRDARVFSFEDEDGKLVAWPPGVRGQSVGLYPDGAPVHFGTGAGDAAVLRNTVRAEGGYTLSGWVRVREAPVSLFLIGRSTAAPTLDVTVSRGQVVAAAGAGPRRPTLKHTWAGDEKWHHVAFVSDRAGTGPKVRLYFDGELVASGPAAAPIPGAAEAVRFGWVAPKFGAGPAKDEVVGAIDECVMFGRPLTDSEVAELAGRPVTPAAPAPRPAPARPVAPSPRPVERD